MNYKLALELLEIERECVKRSGECDRDCGSCELVQDQDELLEMYDFVIRYIKELPDKFMKLQTYKMFGCENELYLSRDDVETCFSLEE